MMWRLVLTRLSTAPPWGLPASARGDEVQRVQMRVFDLDDELEFAKFAVGDSREIKVYGSDDTVIYDPMKRTGIAITRIGASKAIMIGAYAYALSKIDEKDNN